MILTVDVFKCPDSFMPDYYTYKGNVEGYFYVKGRKATGIQYEKERLHASCHNLAHGIAMLQDELPDNFQRKQLIDEILEKEKSE